MAVSKRGVNLDGWDVTWDEYKELDYFCRQYHRKKQEAENLLTLRVSTPQPVVEPEAQEEKADGNTHLWRSRDLTEAARPVRKPMPMRAPVSEQPAVPS